MNTDYKRSKNFEYLLTMNNTEQNDLNSIQVPRLLLHLSLILDSPSPSETCEILDSKTSHFYFCHEKTLDMIHYKKFPFTELQGKLPCSQKPSRNSCHEWNTSNPHLNPILLTHWGRGQLNCLNACSRCLNHLNQLLYCVSLKIYNKFANYFCELKFSGNFRRKVSHGYVLLIDMQKLKRCDMQMWKQCVTKYNVHYNTHAHTQYHKTNQHKTLTSSSPFSVPTNCM